MSNVLNYKFEIVKAQEALNDLEVQRAKHTWTLAFAEQTQATPCSASFPPHTDITKRQLN